MNASDVVEALELPERSNVDRRVPKKLLLENGAPTSADKRFINDGVEELIWVAALKPTTIGVLEFREDVREYLEIAVLHLMLRPHAKSARLAELIHRAVPYPVLLLSDGEHTELSLAHKRWSLNERSKVVLDDEIIGIEWNEAKDGAHRAAFCNALRIGRQPHGSLYELYQGWMDAIQALEAARLSRTFLIPASTEYAIMRRAALKECAFLDSEIARLRAAAVREKQIARQVELNLELKRVEAAFAAARVKI
ncbi:MAG: DUF4391 domain-containing protein [Spirochaetia bacterium]